MSVAAGAGIDAVTRLLQRALPGQVESGAPLAPLTTYRVGGRAAVLVRARREQDLEAVAAAIRDASTPVLVVGRGSNLVVADRGWPGVAVVLEGELEAVATAPVAVTAGGAVPLPVLARRAAAEGLAGLEFFVGIPGTVGGAVRMNAGGHGRETRDVLASAWVADLGADGRARAWSLEALELGYRQSALGPSHVVVRAAFSVQEDDREACEARVADIVRWRREHQPGGANAGSVFRNPPGDAAGRLVDACGLKGLRVGGASVSAKHANFIQADAGATAADVHSLVREIRRRVAATTGVELEPELHFVGFEDEP